MSGIPSYFRTELTNQVFVEIYKRSREVLQAELQTIGERHAAMSNSGNPAFFFKGAVYTAGTFLKGKRPAYLVASLKEAMESYKAHETAMTKEMGVIANYLAATSMLCYSKADFKALLPECVHGFMAHAPDTIEEPRVAPEFAAEYLQRTKQEIQTIQARLVINLIL